MLPMRSTIYSSVSLVTCSAKHTTLCKLFCSFDSIPTPHTMTNLLTAIYMMNFQRIMRSTILAWTISLHPL